MTMPDYKYQMIVYWSEEDSCFLVEVPELPGCMGDGKTIQEAIENTKVIISEWIAAAIADGDPIPEPKGKIIA